MFIASSKNFAPVDVLFAKLYTPKQVLFFSLEILWLNACTCKLDIRHTWVKSDANLYWEYEEQFPYYIFLKNWLLKEKFWVQLKFRRKYRKFFHSLSTEQVQLAPISIPQPDVCWLQLMSLPWQIIISHRSQCVWVLSAGMECSRSFDQRVIKPSELACLFLFPC